MTRRLRRQQSDLTHEEDWQLALTLSRAQKNKWNAVSWLVRDEEKDLGGRQSGRANGKVVAGCEKQSNIFETACTTMAKFS